jgi:hypothetical protein
MRARQYDPFIGRFLARDRLESSTDRPYTGTYVYVNNRPTVATDPTGDCFLICGVVGAIVNTGAYVVQTAVGGESFSWSGAAEAAGEGFVMGATGGYGAKVTDELLVRFGGPAARRAIGGAVGGAVGGSGISQAYSLASGCGFASGGSTFRGALVGAASAAIGEGLLPQRGFPVRTMRGIFRSQKNTKRLWGGAAFASSVGLAFPAESDPCGLGSNGK